MYYKLSLILFITCFQSITANKVDLVLHYESLCPYCKSFILEQLIHTFDELNSIISLQIIPFGNAKYAKITEPDGSFDVNYTCQHGTQECIGNKIHSCVLLTQPINKALDLFKCMFNASDWRTPAEAGHKCADKLQMDWNPISECSLGPLGRGLLLINGEKHNSAIPKPQYVPWVILNGKHTDDIQTKAQKNLFKLICDTYSGIKPKQCLQ